MSAIVELDSPTKKDDIKKNEISYSDKKRCYSVVRTKSIVIDDTFHKYRRLSRFD